MKTILALLIALSACGFDRGYSPDAAQHIADAAIDSPGHDAAPVGSRGCMGNLPTARTITINTGDPIPPSLINELQDNIAGAKHPGLKERYFPSQFPCTGSPATCIQNPAGSTNFAPVWKLPTENVCNAAVPFTVGSRISGFSFDIRGDGVVDVTATVSYYPTIGSGAAAAVTIASGGGSNISSTWGEMTLSMVTNQVLGSTGILYLSLEISSGTFVYVGMVSPTFDRL